MLTIPVLFKQSSALQEEVLPKRQEIPAFTSLDFRREFLQTVNQQDQADFENFVAEHATQIENDLALCADTAVCSIYLQQAKREHAYIEERKHIKQLENYLISVGEKAVSPGVLKHYLQLQKPFYQEQLKAAHYSEKEINSSWKFLQTQAVKNAINRVLADKNYADAQQFLDTFSSCLEEDFIQACEIKIRHEFIQQQAAMWWERACQVCADNPEAAWHWAEENVAEEQQDIRQLILQTIHALYRIARAQRVYAQAQLLSQMAHASVEEAGLLLTQAQVFTPEQLIHFYQVSQALDTLDAHSNPADFMKYYFSATEMENREAYQDGKLSPREYLLAQAACLARTVGEKNEPIYLLCKQAELVLKKKGFSTEDIQQAQYKILTAPNGQTAWQEIQNLFNQ